MPKHRMVDSADDRIERTFGFMKVGDPLNLMMTVHCRPWRGPHKRIKVAVKVKLSNYYPMNLQVQLRHKGTSSGHAASVSMATRGRSNL
jgi:hypothetical protein